MASDGNGSIKVIEGANIYQATQKQKTTTVPEALLLETQEKSTLKSTPKPLDMRVVVSKNSDNHDYTTLHETIDYVFTIDYDV